MNDDFLKLPTSECELADFIYEVANVTDAEEKAAVLWPHIDRITAELDAARKALERILDGSRNQGPFTGMGWLEVEKICTEALTSTAAIPFRDELSLA